jgi:hypothetical protein
MPSDSPKSSRFHDLCGVADDACCEPATQIHFITVKNSGSPSENDRASLDQFLSLWAKFAEDLQQRRVACAVAAKILGRQYAISPNRTIDDNDRLLFEKLYAQWDADTANISNMTKVITHPAYYAIVALGERAIPFILKSLENGDGPWFVALEAIVPEKDRPILSDRGDARRMREAWLDWGRKNDYLEASHFC